MFWRVIFCCCIMLVTINSDKRSKCQSLQSLQFTINLSCYMWFVCGIEVFVDSEAMGVFHCTEGPFIFYGVGGGFDG